MPAGRPFMTLEETGLSINGPTEEVDLAQKSHMGVFFLPTNTSIYISTIQKKKGYHEDTPLAQFCRCEMPSGGRERPRSSRTDEALVGVKRLAEPADSAEFADDRLDRHQVLERDCLSLYVPDLGQGLGEA